MKPQSGSALIMVLCICTVLMIATTSSWYTASLLHDVSCVRQQAFQRKQSVEGLLVYATRQAKQQLEDLWSKTQPTVLYEGAWPSGDSISYNGYAVSYKKNSRLKICVTLKNTDKQVATATALLSHTINSQHGESVGVSDRQEQQSDDGKCSVFVDQWSVNEVDACG